MSETKLDWSEEDGLVITIDDEANLITFEWNEETHPQWNILHELGEDGVNQVLMDYCKQVLSEHETENLRDFGSSD